MRQSLIRVETSGEDSAGPAIPIRWLSDRDRSTIVLAQSGPLGQLGEHTEAAEDLLAVAIAVYCADRVVMRDEGPDGWTRHIQVDVPVRRPDRWDNDLLEQAISFLTGDHWRLKLRCGQPHPGLRTTGRSLITPDAVALFSGGVDSLAGVCTSRQAGETMALASYYDEGSTGRLQKQLVATLGSDHPHCQFRIEWVNRPRSTNRRNPKEPTSRSRSLLFLALGLLVACAQGARRLQMAENGYIALNVPLHQGRIGSLSTRSAHPQFVDDLNQVIGGTDLGVQIDNPYLLMTKGEVAECLMQHASHVAWTTVSCAHPAAGRWRRQPFGNCGYCYPCIIRQAGFHRFGKDDTPYLVDPFSDLGFYGSRTERTSDIRSVARFLLDPVRRGDINATGRVGSHDMVHKLYGMYRRGVSELVNLFEARTTSEVRRELGL